MGSLCSRNQQTRVAGSVLDRVISQASSEDDCLLYKLANYLGGGELLDAYNIGGPKEVEKLIEEQFGIFLYNNGKGKTITKTDYFKWFCRGRGSSVSSRGSGMTSSPSGTALDAESGLLLGVDATKLRNGDSPGINSRNGASKGSATNGQVALMDGLESRRDSLLQAFGSFEYHGRWGKRQLIRSVHDPLVHWTDHPACWRMEYRGALGESLLHVLIMCDTKIHTKLANLLIKIFPRLALDVVEGEEYLGASALHLAIAYHNSDLATSLVECGATINQRAIGSFFQPYDQQCSQPLSETSYDGLAYLGEYPLAWAATCGNEGVYNFLIEKGADADLQDSLGNMVLHVLVVNDKLDMYGYALRHPKRPAKNGILNNNGLTPLTLACKLGRNLIFQEMLELSCIEFWRYSNITCSGYPLNALDTILPSGKTNWNSALMIIINGDSSEHLDMLEGGVIQRLLEEKWKTFARLQFLKRLVIVFIHLLMLTGAVALRKGEYQDANERISAKRSRNSWRFPTTTPTPIDDYDEIEEGVEVVRYTFEIATLLGCLSYIFVQLGGEIANQGFPAFMRSLLGGEIANQGFPAFMRSLLHTPPKAIFLLSNFMLLGCVPFRAIKISRDGKCDWCTKWEDTVLAVAVPCSWFFLMFFAGAVRLTGPFVTMIFSMITGDMVTFGIIYTVIMLGFSQTFYFLYMGHEDRSGTTYASYASTWMGLFHMTLGEYDMDHDKTSYPVLTTFVFCVFMVMVPILLLNMLIAMMGNTYAMVIDRSEKEFVKQWANIVINLERAVNQKDAKEHLMSYSIPLGGSVEDGTAQRAVMVIKSKAKTRARQRKGALSNWKRVGKCTIAELRKRMCTGEQLRNEIFNREGPLPPPPKKKKGAAAIAAQQQQQQQLGQPGAPVQPIVVPAEEQKPVADPFGKIAGIGHGLEPDEEDEEEEDELKPGEETRFSNALSQLAFNADLDIPDGTPNYGLPAVLDETPRDENGDPLPSLPLTGTAGAPNPQLIPNAPKPPVEEPCKKSYAPGSLAVPAAPQTVVVAPADPAHSVPASVKIVSEDKRQAMANKRSKEDEARERRRNSRKSLKDKFWRPKAPAKSRLFGFQMNPEYHSSSMDAILDFDNPGFSDVSYDSDSEPEDSQDGAAAAAARPSAGAASVQQSQSSKTSSIVIEHFFLIIKPYVEAAPEKFTKQRVAESKVAAGVSLQAKNLQAQQKQQIQAAMDSSTAGSGTSKKTKDDIAINRETAEKQKKKSEQQKRERPWTAAQQRKQELEEQQTETVQSLTHVVAWEQDDGF
ncbi:unnamed protein product [Notodromas monacha]|uniref:Ion transport domain-containing protein n=1 Tax=Notodromas monacha TaxID=399045 RepID=A0A7R9GAT3_9CRUS|nr:unnamed protein product [Notodromas monacha]CAG0914329.1 unnamed protein product [Notodromas monacha]